LYNRKNSGLLGSIGLGHNTKLFNRIDFLIESIISQKKLKLNQLKQTEKMCEKIFNEIKEEKVEVITDENEKEDPIQDPNQNLNPPPMNPPPMNLQPMNQNLNPII
jgi:hypothetical protein